ncbi:SDR family NAD(P)-dependent oxidoreductase [Chryseolinea lacunae]|uniref:SDR family NAD(P)-dependent oxidoreductase n=1 Tax=Chryseolinea lacunae TaxID=2801331 RepID=A0ABS1L127_9BACT|nr:SDR family NAD(P)-dependent oxidoreductase [Chryseolinea lacunae]MBL0745411.1 SDR family NAD(P)-dependent oxidoreductase [Chryseolinea lacunae]
MNKLIVVTGGTRGIGRAVIETFARQGFDVATCARQQPALDQLKRDVEQAHGVTVYTQPADLADRAQVKSFSAFINALQRPVDVLVNNAGFFVPGQIIAEPDGVLESMINANLYSAYNMTRGLIGNMQQHASGHIFNLCSIASFMAYPNGGSYAISKFALLGFSKCLREELKTTGIRVTAIMPGATRTESWDGTSLPDERFMKSEDVAEAIYSAYALSGRSVVEEIIIRPQLGDL